jgi:hypothetical protein
MSFIFDFQEGLNKAVLNGIDIGKKSLDNTVDKVESNIQKGINTTLNTTQTGIKIIESPATKLINTLDNTINHNLNMIEKSYNKKRDFGIDKKINNVVKDYSKNVKKIEKVSSTETNKLVNLYNKTIKNNLEEVTNSTIKEYDSILTKFYKYLFNTLIKPNDKNAIYEEGNMNFFLLILTFLLLLLTKINSIIVDNSIGRVRNIIERVIGYRLDGRPIGPPKKKYICFCFSYIT